jgi:prepilin-type N-terminal cleavage/methylation domain-containing protein
MRRHSRSGFTLIEVMVALAVAAVVVLGARLALEQLADDAGRIIDGAVLADRDANAERLLRSLFRRLEVGTGSAGTFGGDERSMSFTTWCDVPGGWQERCEATLAIDTIGDEPALLARLSTTRPREGAGSAAGVRESPCRARWGSWWMTIR